MTCTHVVRDRVTKTVWRYLSDGRRVVTSGANPWATVQGPGGAARVVEGATQAAAVERAMGEGA